MFSELKRGFRGGERKRRDVGSVTNNEFPLLHSAYDTTRCIYGFHDFTKREFVCHLTYILRDEMR